MGEDGLLMKDVKDGRFSMKLFYLLLAMARDSLLVFFLPVLSRIFRCPPKLASLLRKLLRAKC